MIRRVLWENRALLLLFVVSVCIFVIVFFFYGIPLEAVFYPALLTMVLIVIYVAYALYRRKKKHDALCEMAKLPGALMTQFPSIDTMIEEDYQNIIHALQDGMEQALPGHDGLLYYLGTPDQNTHCLYAIVITGRRQR